VTDLGVQCKERMDDYLARKLQRERQAAREAADAARKQAEEAARKAAEAIERDPAHADVALQLAEQAAAIAEEKSAVAEAKPAELTRVRGSAGAVLSMRTSWTYQVVDFALVPDPWKTIDDKKVKAAMKARDPQTGRPTRSIPGIEWVQQTSAGVR